MGIDLIRLRQQSLALLEESRPLTTTPTRQRETRFPFLQVDGNIDLYPMILVITQWLTERVNCWLQSNSHFFLDICQHKTMFEYTVVYFTFSSRATTRFTSIINEFKMSLPIMDMHTSAARSCTPMFSTQTFWVESITANEIHILNGLYSNTSSYLVKFAKAVLI